MKTCSLSVCCVLAVFLLTVGSITPANALEFGVRGYYWFPTFKSDLKLNSGSTSGTEFNVKDTFGLPSEGIPSVEAYAGIGKHHASLMYTGVKYSGTQTLSSPVTFGGKSYGGSVTGDFSFRMIDAEYQYDFLNLENFLAGFSIGAIGKFKYFEGEAKLYNTTNGETSQTFNLPIPMIGIGAHVGILADLLEARAKITGMGYSGNYIYEALADISVTPFPFVDIHGGYKVIAVKVDNISDVTANPSFQGPYIALTIGW
jgi:hypothetical protein